jgi:hypothetical protein
LVGYCDARIIGLFPLQVFVDGRLATGVPLLDHV